MSGLMAPGLGISLTTQLARMVCEFDLQSTAHAKIKSEAWLTGIIVRKKKKKKQEAGERELLFTKQRD